MPVHSDSATLSNIPWEDRPAGSREVLWRYSRNPIIPRDLISCAALFDPPSGRIAVYYGGADTVTALAFCRVHEVLEWLKQNSDV